MTMNNSPDISCGGKPVLLVPGIGNSGPEHWQSLWQAANKVWVRVAQRDWDRPVCNEWLDALTATVRQAGVAPFIVAHSLGCLLAAHWLVQSSHPIAGVLLVAVPNPEGANFPNKAVGFAPVPQNRLPCPSIVVASTNDPYGDIEFAERCASNWGNRFVNVGNAGHINGASGLREWHQGQQLLRELATDALRTVV
jgi:uncharacterized protein